MVDVVDPKLPEAEEDETDLPLTEAPEDPGVPFSDDTTFDDGAGWE